MDFEKRFDKFDDEYLKFERIKNKRSNRPDLHAFLLLDEICQGKKDIVAAAEHDEIFLSIGVGDILAITDEQICELVRCGVRYDPQDDSLCMFV